MFLSSRTGRKGFTLVELLVTVSIIALLVAILLPALGRARRSALASASGSNISAFGRAMAIEASAGVDGQLVSGGFDWYRDGDVRKIGWVSDMVDAGVINPGKALDPASPHRVSEKVLDYAGMVNSVSKVGIGYWATTATDDATDNALASLPTGTDFDDMWDEGHNTNYATSWQLIRGDPNASFADEARKLPGEGNGPVTIDELSLAFGGASAVPLLAESRAGSQGDASLNQSSDNVNGSWAAAAAPSTNQAGLDIFAGDDARSGGWAVESFNDGMNAQERRTGKTGATIGTGASQLTNVVHEYNDFWPHQLSKRADVDLDGDNVGDFPGQDIPVAGFCTILFGDFSARRISDSGSFIADNVGDGWIGAAPQGFGSGDFGTFELHDGMDDEISGIGVGLITPTYTGGGGVLE